MEAFSTVTVELLAVGLTGACTDETVKTENGAKRNSTSLSTLLFSTRLTCLQRNLQFRMTRSSHAAHTANAHLSDYSPLGSTRTIQCTGGKPESNAVSQILVPQREAKRHKRVRRRGRRT